MKNSIKDLDPTMVPKKKSVVIRLDERLIQALKDEAKEMERKGKARVSFNKALVHFVVRGLAYRR